MTRQVLRISSIVVALLVAVGCQPKGEPGAGESAQPVGSAAAAGAAADDPTVAEVHGRRVPLSELDDFVKDQLFAKASSDGDALKLYELRSEALNQLVDRIAVEQAAAEAGLEPDAFLNREVVPAGEIPAEEVAEYYENHKAEMGDATLEQIEPRIRGYLRQQRGVQLVADLRKKAGATILIEPPRFEVAGEGPAQGPADAPVTIVEFSDFQCPYCQRAVPTIQQILEKYPQQVRVVFRHLPLDRIHARARPAAEASACAHEQGKFWEFHDLVFDNNRKLSDEDLEGYASSAGLEMDAFRECAGERRFKDLVQADAEAAGTLGLRGTPAFFVNGIPMHGAKPFPEFVRLIDAELARLGAS